MNDTATLSVIVHLSHGQWLAQAIDVDLCGHGATQAAALAELARLMEARATVEAETGALPLGPAPEEERGRAVRALDAKAGAGPSYADLRKMLAEEMRRTGVAYTMFEDERSRAGALKVRLAEVEAERNELGDTVDALIADRQVERDDLHYVLRRASKETP